MPFTPHVCQFEDDWDTDEEGRGPTFVCWRHFRSDCSEEDIAEFERRCSSRNHCMNPIRVVEGDTRLLSCDEPEGYHYAWRGTLYCSPEWCPACVRPYRSPSCLHVVPLPADDSAESRRDQRERNAHRFPVEGDEKTQATAWGLRVGVEIEVCRPGIAEVSAILSRNGIIAPEASYGHRTQGHWRVTSDATVLRGAEVVSPPLSPEDAPEAISRVMAILRRNGVKVNRDCGCHIHFDAGPLGARWVAEYAATYTHVNRAIDAFLPPSRRSIISDEGDDINEYAMPWQEHELSRLEPLRERGVQVENITRYKTVNIQALFRHGTVEVRQHSGTLSGEKINAWIGLQRAILSMTASGLYLAEGEHLTDAEHLLAEATGHGLDNDTAGYLSERVYELGRV